MTEATSRSLSPSISVVIATYHNPPRYSDRQYVAECLTAARQQTILTPEVLVVDGSPLYPMDAKWMKAIPRTWHFEIPDDWSVCDALKFGVRQSEADWAIPMNADDQLAPHFVESALVAADAFHLRQLSVAQRCGVVVVSQQPLSAAIERDNYIPYLAMFARWFWDEMGGFVDVLGEGGACRLADWDLWIRVWQRYGERAPVAYITDPSVIRIRNRPDSASKWSSDEFKALRARLWAARGIEP